MCVIRTDLTDEDTASFYVPLTLLENNFDPIFVLSARSSENEVGSVEFTFRKQIGQIANILRWR